MHARNQSVRWWPLTVICLVAGGCASTGAPKGWLPEAKEAPRDPYGSWVTVAFANQYSEDNLAGEFLAVDADSLYVLEGYSGTRDPVTGVSLDLVRTAKIASFDPQTNLAAGWAVFGALTSLSHGWGAAVSVPLWIIVGSISAGSHSRTPLKNYPDYSWDELKMYARFPQGPPPGLHQLDLQPKPHANSTSSKSWSEKETVF